MAHSLLPPNPWRPHLSSIHSSRARFVLPYGGVEISRSARRHRRLELRAVQSTGGGAAEPSPGGPNSNIGSTPSTNPSFNLSGLPRWVTWLFGIFFTAMPVYRRIMMVEEVVEKTVENVIETVEKAAEVTEKVAMDFAESLPDGKLKEVVLKVEKIAERVDEDAEKAEALLEKVDEVKEKVEDILNPILGGEVNVKDLQAKKATTTGVDSEKAS